MFKNYFKLVFRNMQKNKLFSAINILGLAIGMAACLLILQYVSFELSYDQFNPKLKNIYRVVNDRYQNGKLVQHGTITYSAIGKALKNDYPQEVVDNVRVEPLNNIIISNEERRLQTMGIAVENNFFDMFSYPVVAGDKLTPLKEVNTIVITESLAKNIFSLQEKDIDACIGRSIKLDQDKLPYKITAVCKDAPENSHLQFAFMMSYQSMYSGGNGNWKEADYDFTDSDFWHYIELKEGVDYKKFQAKLAAFSQRHFQGNKVSGSDEKFYLQPLSKAHLYSDFEYEIGKVGSATRVWGLLIIALFIVLIAWVNYINLATAKSVERAKEVGVRKVVGAVRQQLIKQFLFESIFVNVLSFVLAIGIVFATQKAFNQLVGHQLSLSYLFAKGLSGYSILGGLSLLLVTGILISGFYPAFVLSSFKPISVLKGRMSTSRRGVVLRKALVIGQFAITAALIVGSIIVFRQIRFMNKQELGFNMDQVLIVKAPYLTSWDSTFISRVDAFKEELKKIPNVKAAASSARQPGDELGRAFNVHRVDDNSGNNYTMRNWGISYDLFDVYQMKLLAGRKFSPTDHNPDFARLHNAMITENGAALLGFKSPQEAIGKQVSMFGRNWDIIGVTGNFHQKSLRYPVEPTMIIPTYGTNASFSIKINPADLTTTITGIRKKFDQFFSGNLFDYYFLDEKFNEQYKDDRLFGEVFGLFAGFAIFIACMGLFGLSLFATTQRIKEIGVRKVLGASVSSIVLLLSKDFIKLVLIANLLAFPVAWWIMHNWLNDFAYRINISWQVFAIATLMAIFVAVITISFQAIKAALSNPVKSLRTE